MIIPVALVGQQLQASGHIAEQRRHFPAIRAEHPRSNIPLADTDTRSEFKPLGNEGIPFVSSRALRRFQPVYRFGFRNRVGPLEAPLHPPVAGRRAVGRLHAVNDTENLALGAAEFAGGPCHEPSHGVGDEDYFFTLPPHVPISGYYGVDVAGEPFTGKPVGGGPVVAEGMYRKLGEKVHGPVPLPRLQLLDYRPVAAP